MVSKELKQLERENKKIRNKIDKILLEYLSTIDDNYSDIWELVDDLVDTEIEMESMCNQ